MSDLFNKLLILRTPKIGPVKYAEIIEQFGSADLASEAIGVIDTIRDSVAREMDMAAKLNITYISDDDDLYPANLRLIKNHPPVITARGNLGALKKRAFGMVGTRHASAAGMDFMMNLAESFASHDIAVVSGMAMGADSAAHRGALRAAGNTQTIAVLGGGVDYIWPQENESLYFEILERGVVISEMPVGFKPVGSNFVQRNRWIAGCAEKLILGEADIKSGSMTTARFAKDYKKRIFAVPGHPSDARSRGPNSLIKSGDATLCMSLNDFFNDANIGENKKNKITENDILDKLGMIPVSESVLANLVKKTVAEIKTDLVMLELQGLIRKQDGGYVLN